MVKLKLKENEVELIQQALMVSYNLTWKDRVNKRVELARLQLKIENQQSKQEYMR